MWQGAQGRMECGTVMGKLNGKQMRTCLICKRREQKSKLLRFVWLAGELHWDRGQKLPGRGAYVHGKPGCLTSLTQVGVWERALHLGAELLSAGQLCGALSAAWKQVMAVEGEPISPGKKFRGVRL